MKKVVLLVVAVCLTVFSFAQDQNASELVTKANDAVAAKDYAKAVELFEQVLAIPDNGQDTEQISKVLNQLKPIVDKDNAKTAYENKEYDKAVDLYSKMIEVYPDDKAEFSFNAGLAAYQGKEYQKAVDFFTVAVAGDYKGETSQYYKAVALNKLNKDAEYKAALEEGVAKFAGDDKLSKALANVYVSEGNELYKKGAGILSAANSKVNDGSMSTADDAYTAEVAKSKKEFAAALEVLEKAAALDASNANAQKLIEACKAAM